MSYKKEQLQNLQKQISQKKQLEAKLDALHNKRRNLIDKIEKLDYAKMEEQADVEKLEKTNITSLFYRATGKIYQKLEKERREASEAKAKYDAAAWELENVRNDFKKYEQELREIQDCEKQYTQMLQEQLNFIKTSAHPKVDEILQLEEKISRIQNQKREIQEALSAGRTALNTAKSVTSSLNSAKDLSNWDILGGGLLVDMAKHDHLDTAQGKMVQLQNQLNRFRTELADVTIHADFQVNIEGSLRAADYIFDGIFADMAVRDKIQQSQGQLKQTEFQIQNALHQLNNMLRDADQEELKTREELEHLVVESLAAM